MNNRKDVPAVMKKPKLKKGEKDAHRNNENILLLAWRDKHLVTMLSTWSTLKSEPVRRKVRGRKEEEMVEKPSIIANYMKNMGGVDTADQYCATYCFLRRTLKLWRKIILLGFGGFNHQCIHSVCGKMQE